MIPYHRAADPERLLAAYPIGPAFLERIGTLSRDELHAVRNARFGALMARGWTIPFYRRRWSAAGIEPGDIRGIEDLARLPTYDKADLMASVAEHGPLGDFTGLSDRPDRPPQILHTTSGTTGRPQPLLFGPKGREVASILVARMALWLGLRHDDVVHSVYGHGLINGGHYIREAYTRYTNAMFLSAGTGVETRSAAQVRLMADFGATVLVGFVDYLRKLAATAREEGVAPPVRMIIAHLGTEHRAATEAAWGGAKAFDWYGVGDTGCIAAEGPERDGLHVWEDAQALEIADIATGAPVADGEAGDMVVTTLYKDDLAPCIRFNTHDLSAWLPDRAGAVPFRRIRGFLGRSDNMVKLRGINVFPHAVAAIIENRAELTGEYVCRVARDGTGREELTVVLEHHAPGDPPPYAALLRDRLGLEVAVDSCPRRHRALTEIDRRQKPLRLLDDRR